MQHILNVQRTWSKIDKKQNQGFPHDIDSTFIFKGRNISLNKTKIYIAGLKYLGPFTSMHPSYFLFANV